MRLLTAAVTLVATAALTVPASAATPHPSTCTAKAHGAVVPANPADLVASAAVAVYGAEVTCQRDPLTTPPIDHLTPFSGDMTVYVVTASGAELCGVGGFFPSVSSTLVMAVESACVIPVTDPRRTEPLYVQVWWATHPPYVCCGSHRIPVQPVGVG